MTDEPVVLTDKGNRLLVDWEIKTVKVFNPGGQVWEILGYLGDVRKTLIPLPMLPEGLVGRSPTCGVLYSGTPGLYYEFDPDLSRWFELRILNIIAAVNVVMPVEHITFTAKLHQQIIQPQQQPIKSIVHHAPEGWITQ